MELWLRYHHAKGLEWDERFIVHSQEEWAQLIKEHQPIGSILWPIEPIFPIIPTTPVPYFNRRHPHEKNYKNNTKRNLSYLQAAKTLATRIKKKYSGAKILVYAPLRGAFPIWKAVSQFLYNQDITVYYPTTSSFVFYPKEFKIINPKGRIASGRFTHILELKRLKPFYHEYDYLLFIDEIVSGGMMAGYLKDMADLNIFKSIKIIAAGLADEWGRRSQIKRSQILSFIEKGILHDFIWEGCDSLITQDQKFLLGIHYSNYHSGLNIIPVFTKEGKRFPEKILFDQDVFL